MTTTTEPPRGLGAPFVRDGDPVHYLPVRCPACGGQLEPVAIGPGTPPVVVRVAYRCVRIKCGGRSQSAAWIVTTTIRGIKDHELKALLDGKPADLDIDVPDLDDDTESS